MYCVTSKLGVFETQTLTFVACFEGRKEGNVLFNDTLNTFYLWLYGVRQNNLDPEFCDYLHPNTYSEGMIGFVYKHMCEVIH